MRVGVIPESLLERIGLRTGLAPVPLAEGLFSFLLARTVMIGTRLGIFESLAKGPLTAANVALTCATDVRGTERLLHALTGCKYVAVSPPSGAGAEAEYALTDLARRWLLASSVGSCRDRMLLQFLEWEWFEHAEEYVRTGVPHDAFTQLSAEGWGLYQRGMRAGVAPLASELARRIPLKGKPTHMLDVGGGHGHYSVALCRRHASLSSTILELPEAIPHAAEVLLRDGMGDRVVHRAGDALRTDLGEAQFDLVLLASVLHHFDDKECGELMVRVARALRPGGIVAVFDVFRRGPFEAPGQVGGLLDLFLGTISAAGTRAPTELAAFQRAAGLVPRRTIRLHIAPDIGAQCATKPGG